MRKVYPIKEMKRQFINIPTSRPVDLYKTLEAYTASMSIDRWE